MNGHRINVNRQDFATAIFLILLGIAGFVASSALPVGTAMRMGGGYVPRLLSFLLLGFGGILIVQSLFGNGERVQKTVLRPLVFVLVVPLIFAALIDTLGLPLTVLFCVLAAGLASSETRRWEILAVGAGLAVLTYVLFVTALGLPMQFGPEFG
ncbi:MAG TPA: tripartite tricarboxylate transporter TctB family protein [Paracoccus sp. (in: a-proteobacteria)]|uniref:tripartite tricarboxylate transporter TctB family protein n=1 Tax=Paracoccus sp. TaxID=267 RepID=UPI002B83E8C8|nr:tripartite tricarboxylate transporter TctB family protein [Paracoccus sp. (in: a-proteobacteria)]HWL59034.1 tripartite tricarboxylate transporter TctB family protein [Paracoccus sp. (in: a-proteobacteria)]